MPCLCIWHMWQVRELQATAVPPAAAAAAATASAAAGASPASPQTAAAAALTAAAASGRPPGAVGVSGTASTSGIQRGMERPQASLNGRAFLRLGIWQWAMNDVSWHRAVHGMPTCVQGMHTSAKQGNSWSCMLWPVGAAEAGCPWGDLRHLGLLQGVH
jgi:hypothetical protein